MLYRTDPCKGAGVAACGRKDGGSKKLTDSLIAEKGSKPKSDTLGKVAGHKPSTAARKDVPGKTTVRDALAQIGEDPVKAAQPPVSEEAAFASTGDSIRTRVPEDNIPAGTQAPPVDVSTLLTKRGAPRKRAPKGTFDRKAYQREAARKRRAEAKGKT